MAECSWNTNVTVRFVFCPPSEMNPSELLCISHKSYSLYEIWFAFLHIFKTCLQIEAVPWNFMRITLETTTKIYFKGNKPRAGFLNLSTTGILDKVVVCWGICPVHCMILSSTHGLCLLDLSSTLPPLLQIVIMKSFSRHCQLSPEGQNHPS